MTTKNDEQKKSLADKVSAVLQKNRLVFLSVISVFLVAIIAVSVIFAITESTNKKTFESIDKIVYSLSQAPEDSLDAEKEKALSELQQIAEKNKKGAVAVRTYLSIADIQYSNQNWEEAINAWKSAANADPKSYTAAICYYNIASCYEELADINSALSFYEKVLTDDDCVFITRTLFDLGRVNENLGDFTKAAEYYNRLTADYASDAWATLAESRLISLKIDGKI